MHTIDSSFQMQEYLARLIRSDPADIDRIVTLPEDGSESEDSLQWVYEHLRRIPLDLVPLVNALLGVCTRQSCPEMKAGEWQYLCVAHVGGNGDGCCAIDYTLHT